MTTEQKIHRAAMQILEKTGVKFHNEKALKILRKNNVRLEGNTAFFTEEEIMHWVKKAPSSFTLHARNPKYNTIVGGDHVNASPAYGCAFIAEKDGSQRPGTIADYVKAVRLVHASEVYTIDGGIIIQPSDVPDRTSAIDMFYATFLNSDKAIMVPTSDADVTEAIMKSGCKIFGGYDEYVSKPRMFTLINTNSPLALERRMLDNLMIFAEYGQPVILSPASMLGATSPLTMAGTLASNACEVLAGIALAQMIRPGTPVVYGVQSTAVDMRGVTFACASPEGAAMQSFGARMARFYDLPSRGGGSQTDAPTTNMQAGYESMFTFLSAYKGGINLILEAGGVLASVNATSFEKMICDFEIIRMVKTLCTPIEVNEETLCLEDIMEEAHDGSFLTCDYTLDNFMDLYQPHIGSRNAKPSSYFEDSIDAEMERLLAVANSTKPVLDAVLMKEVKDILATTGIDKEQLSAIETM